MADMESAPEGQRALLQSLTLKGAAAMAVAFVAARLGARTDDPTIQAFVEALVNLVFYGGLLAVGVGRARAGGPLAGGR